MTYFKAVRPDGTDFHTGTVRWAPALRRGRPPDGVVAHPTSTVWEEDHATHLCASTSPTDCTGFSWPCRLLEVEPVSEVHRHAGSKRSALSWRVVRELSAVEALGPQGPAVATLLDGLDRVVPTRLVALSAAWDAARDAARLAAWRAAPSAAAGALVVWDLITPGQRDILTAPTRTALSNLWADVTKHLPD